MTAVLPRLPAAKQRRKVSEKLLKVLVYLLESCRIHFPTSPAKTFSSYPGILSL